MSTRPPRGGLAAAGERPVRAHRHRALPASSPSIAERGKLDSVFFADSPALCGRRRPPARAALEPTVAARPRSPAVDRADRADRHRVHDATTSRTTWPAGSPRSTTLAAAGPAGTSSPPPAPTPPATSASTSCPAHADALPTGPRSSSTSSPKLWDSWDDDAVVADKEAGVCADADRGPRDRPRGRALPGRAARSTLPRSPQGRPVLVQAGSSEDGKDFAARYAEAVFTAQQTLEDAQAFYADVKQRAAAARPRPGPRQDPARASSRSSATPRRRPRALDARARPADRPRVRPAPARQDARRRPRRPASSTSRCPRDLPDRGRDRGRQEPLHADRDARPAGAPDRAPADRPARRRPRPPHLRRHAGAGRRHDRGLVRQRRRRRLQRDAAGAALAASTASSTRSSRSSRSAGCSAPSTPAPPCATTTACRAPTRHHHPVAPQHPPRRVPVGA